MTLLYRIAADAVVVLHAAYVTFIVLGLIAILLGTWRGWGWVRKRWFRLAHLAMILIVVAEAWLGLTCPLTIWEKDLRRLAGEEVYHGDFIAAAVHDVLFFDLPPWVFTAIYTLFGLTVLATWIFAPPRWRNESPRAASRGT
ncbi:MAG: DUF2784 domain-containing protein [Planctomycetaceae bacterium]